jgi:hypothetical protein
MIGEDKGFAAFKSETNGKLCLDESNILLMQNNKAAEFCLETGKQDDRLVQIVKNSIYERGFTLMMCLDTELGDDTVYTDEDFANNYRFTLVEE